LMKSTIYRRQKMHFGQDYPRAAS